MIYEIKGLSFSYLGSDARVLNGVDFAVDTGDVISILGKNGAGKSTLLSCMLGLLEAYEGEVLLVGRSVNSLSEREIASVAGYVPQTHQPSFGYSVLDFVLMGCAPWQIRASGYRRQAYHWARGRSDNLREALEHLRNRRPARVH